MGKHTDSYFTNEYINIYKYFSESQIKLLKLVNITIENKEYSLDYFDDLKGKIIDFYYAPTEELTEKNISKEQIKELLDIIHKISNDYSI